MRGVDFHAVVQEYHSEDIESYIPGGDIMIHDAHWEVLHLVVVWLVKSNVYIYIEGNVNQIKVDRIALQIKFSPRITDGEVEDDRKRSRTDFVSE